VDVLKEKVSMGVFVRGMSSWEGCLHGRKSSWEGMGLRSSSGQQWSSWGAVVFIGEVFIGEVVGGRLHGRKSS
jgi:hypothetical protein